MHIKFGLTRREILCDTIVGEGISRRLAEAGGVS